MLVMGVESSCDETAVSIVQKKKSGGGRIIKEIVYSQVENHIPYGGVVPELSSREHIRYLDKITKQVLKESKIKIKQLDGIAAATGPGLLGGLLIGSNYAKAICIANKKPFLAINHLQAHILVSRMDFNFSFPFLVLLISGGHTQLLIVKKFNEFELLGESIDDALGEAFDKTAKLLGLKYPGGPEIENYALKNSKKNTFRLPKPLFQKNNLDFSFSGLKTAVRRIIESEISQEQKYNLAYDFQYTVLECLKDRCGKAMDLFQEKYGTGCFILSGGVASNVFLRQGLKNLSETKAMRFFVPRPELCVDNASMIAWAGIEKILSNNLIDDIEVLPAPRWSLVELSNE